MSFSPAPTPDSERPLASPPRSGGVVGWLTVLAYLVTACALTWPLITELTTAIPQGQETVPTVPLLNLWTVWWNGDRAAHACADYWDAPIFYPARATFVFSEAQPTTIVVAPLVWWREDAILAYNVYLLVSLFLNGLMTRRLLREQGFHPWSAAAAGVLMQTLPFVVWQLGVLQLALVWPSLWTIAAGLRFVASPRWLKALELGVAFGVTYASCNYYGLFLAVLLPPAAVWYLNRSWLAPRSWFKLGLAATVAAALIFPIVRQQRAESARHSWQRDPETVTSLSAHIRDYTDTPAPQWLDAWEDRSPRHNLWTLGSGWLKLIAAAIGVVIGLVFPGYRRWTLFAASFGLFAWMDSLGPEFEMWNLSPYGLLQAYVPGFAQIRSPFRFALFVQMAIVWLAVVCIDGALRAKFLQRPGRGWGVLRWGLALVITGVCLAETLPLPTKLHHPQAAQAVPLWVEFVREETPERSVLACLPFCRGRTVEEYQIEAEWMLWGTRHRRRMLNGYSGYFPDAYVDLKDELRAFPKQGVPRLRSLGADYAVIQRAFRTQASIERHAATRDWEWVFSDERALVDIYRLPRDHD